MITVTFNECEEALSKLADIPMYESDTEKDVSVVNADAARSCHFRNS